MNKAKDKTMVLPPCSVGLECAQCADGLVNSNERLAVLARYSLQQQDVREDDVRFVWALYVVQDGSHDLSSIGESPFGESIVAPRGFPCHFWL